MTTEFYKAIKSINNEALSEEDKEELLRLFMVTNDSLIRDYIAIVFSDTHFDKAVPYILKKIKDKKLRNNNGTLIAALRELDASEHFNEFAKIICTQDYEARLWALDLIEDFVNIVPLRLKKRALNTLSSYKESSDSFQQMDDEHSRLDFINQAVEIIESSEKKV
ncbi:hypothetical protein HDF24_07500 [Mucilaginibacter sp. X4EP1]|uniref:hypothetical protein n=1 Tax=Mucilaginibacter sp. X4EP1 TaxID=2723092 RepID=UPI0021672C54|nr:hypothetical protein [Mucilaginibacter sp. X4EP1]MCS3814159.1 hypothetical protein [Mucilaginibacter sp. X4EP1]